MCSSIETHREIGGRYMNIQGYLYLHFLVLSGEESWRQ